MPAVQYFFLLVFLCQNFLDFFSIESDFWIKYDHCSYWTFGQNVYQMKVFCGLGKSDYYFPPLFFILHSFQLLFGSQKRRCQNNPSRLCSLSRSEKFSNFSESGSSHKISSMRALTRMTLQFCRTHFPHLWNSEKFQVSI